MSTEHSDHFFRHSFLVLILTNIGSVTNLLFHVVMGRLLSKAEYGVMTSLLGVFLIFATPMLALQNTIAHFTKRFLDDLSPGLVLRLAGMWFRRVSLVGVTLMIFTFFFRENITSMLNLENAQPIMVVAGLIAISLTLPVFLGVLQGYQYFTKMCVVGNIWAVIRLIGGGMIVYFLMPTATAALGSHLAGLLISLLMAVVFVYGTRNSADETEKNTAELINTDSYFFFSVIALFLFSALMNGDIVLVKAYFPNLEDFGSYNRASTIARTLIFLSQPLAIALFPKVATGGRMSANHTIILLKGLLLSGVFIGAALLLCLLWPQLPIILLYGKDAVDAQTVSLVRRVTIAMAPTGITQVLICYEMAQKRFSFIIPLALCAIAMPIGYAALHATLFQSVVILSAVSYGGMILTAMCTIFWFFNDARENRQL